MTGWETFAVFAAALLYLTLSSIDSHLKRVVELLTQQRRERLYGDDK